MMSASAAAIYAVRMEHDAAGAEQEQIARWSARVPEERAARIARFRHWEDQWRSLAGDMLVRAVLQRRYGLRAEQLTVIRGPHGKPRLVGDDVHYNVSHSGIWAVAAFHTEPIGVDIERIGRADMQLAKSMFEASEYDALAVLPDCERDRSFFAIWTGKESYIKAVGRGLSIPLDSFSVAARHNGGGLLPAVKVAGSLGTEPAWHLRAFELDADYMLSACSTRDAWPDRVHIMTAAELD